MLTNKKALAALLAASPFMLAACGGSDGGGGTVVTPPDEGTCPDDITFATDGVADNSCVLSGTIAEDVTLTNNITWVLSGGVFIGEDVGADAANPDPAGVEATLTIEPGTTLVGQSGADFLVINRGSQIIAEGTATNPIVMTSATESGRGEWGGLIINGRASINGCPAGTAICTAEGEGSTGEYGGNDDTDSSGSLEYVIVKHAGFEITPENELNGIAFQGVGNGTNVDFVQVHLNADDGVEFFGGTVNAKHLVLTGIGDDSIDWTQGWRGKVQYAVVKQFADDGDQGIEADNNGDNNDSTPRAKPILSNLTFVGSSNADIGMLLREGTGANLYNVIVDGFGEYCIDIDQSSTFTNAGAPGSRTGNLTIENSIVFDCALGAFDDEAGDPWLVSDWYEDEGLDTSAANSSNLVVDPELVNYIPAANSRAILDANQQPAGETPADAFFTTVDYIGAVKSSAEDWTQPWAVGLSDEIGSCPDFATAEINDSPLTCQLSGMLEGDLTLTNDTIWVLQGGVFVGQDAGADTSAPAATASSLTIDAGTQIVGQSGLDFLVINRGSQIFVNGTESSPVVMTSAAESGRGEWGGLIINGRATINGCAGGVAICTAEGEGSTGEYGGNDDADSSGSIEYLVLKHAGYEITTENELNGIAFQGVGSGTTVDHVQVHLNADDGVEFFGGTVNAKHLVLTGIADDSIDWTQGWRGNVQFGVVKQYTDDGDQGIEADNNGDDNDSLPRSRPTLANITFLGSANADIGMLLREGTAANLYNMIVTGFGEHCIDIDQLATFTNAGATAGGAQTNGELELDHSIVFGCNGGGANANFADAETNGGSFVDPWLVSDWYNAGVSNSVEDPDLANYIPNVGSPALSKGVTPAGTFFDAVDFVGGVKDSTGDWTSGWTTGLDKTTP